MEWQPAWETPVAQFFAAFASLIGDMRTARTFAAILFGLIAAGSTICTQIGHPRTHLDKNQR